MCGRLSAHIVMSDKRYNFVPWDNDDETVELGTRKYKQWWTSSLVDLRL